MKYKWKKKNRTLEETRLTEREWEDAMALGNHMGLAYERIFHNMKKILRKKQRNHISVKNKSLYAIRYYNKIKRR